MSTCIDRGSCAGARILLPQAIKQHISTCINRGSCAGACILLPQAIKQHISTCINRGSCAGARILLPQAIKQHISTCINRGPCAGACILLPQVVNQHMSTRVAEVLLRMDNAQDVITMLWALSKHRWVVFLRLPLQLCPGWHVTVVGDCAALQDVLNVQDF